MPDAEAINATNKLIIDQGVAVVALLMFFAVFMVGAFIIWKALGYMDRESRQLEQVLNIFSGMKASIDANTAAAQNSAATLAAALEAVVQSRSAMRDVVEANARIVATNTLAVETQARAVREHSAKLGTLEASMDTHRDAITQAVADLKPLIEQVKTGIEQLATPDSPWCLELSSLTARMTAVIEQCTSQKAITPMGADQSPKIPNSTKEKEHSDDDSGEINDGIICVAGVPVPAGGDSGDGSGNGADGGADSGTGEPVVG